ncbi:MAG: acyl-CoA thioesterase [Solirubrobacterales bacterium]
MAEVFKARFKVRWGDLDFNAHMANTAYLNTAADVRMMHFEANGFSARNFEELRIGPVVMRDEIEYYKELRLLEDLEVHLMLAGMSADGSRFKLRNIFYRADGKKSATITSTAGWLNLDQRFLIRPPEGLYNAIANLAHTDDYEDLPKSIR